MTYTLPPLAYTYDALEPHIDNQTYVDKLNAALEGCDVTDAHRTRKPGGTSTALPSVTTSACNTRPA